MQVVEHAFLIDVAHLGAFDQGVMEPQLLGETLQDKALAASRRAIEQDAIDSRQFIYLCFLRILQGKQDLLTQLFLEFVATRHIVETAARAFLHRDGRSQIGVFLHAFFIGLLVVFHQLGQLRHHLFYQRLSKIGGRHKAVATLLGEGLLQDGFHIVGQFHLLRLQDEVLFTRFLHGFSNLLLIAIERPQVYRLPRRLAEQQEIKQGTR